MLASYYDEHTALIAKKYDENFHKMGEVRHQNAKADSEGERSSATKWPVLRAIASSVLCTAVIGLLVWLLIWLAVDVLLLGITTTPHFVHHHKNTAANLGMPLSPS